jgi:hypothetical protein
MMRRAECPELAAVTAWSSVALLVAASLAACGTDAPTSGTSSGRGSTSTPASSSSASGSTGRSGSTSSNRLDGGSLVTIPLTGCPLDSYFAPVTIGGQPFTMILDTGSTDTAVALSTCTTCGVSPEFSAPAGSCSAQLTTQQSLGWIGGVCSETMSVGGELPAVTVNVVGISSNVEFFTAVDCTQQPLSGGAPQYQGILGMGPIGMDTIGQEADDAYFNALVAEGVADSFGLLLCSVGGRAWFGGYDSTLASGPPRYTPLSKPSGWAISVSSIGLGATNVGEGAPQSIVDTGTQFYSMPDAAYQSFISQTDSGFATIFGSDTLSSIYAAHRTCVAPGGGQTQAQIDAVLPPMTMTLPSVGGGSFTLSLPATASYLVPATPADGGALQYCLAIADSTQTGGYSILGGPMLRANITLFDLADARVGFIPQDFCN